jgi:hypothetical protein
MSSLLEQAVEKVVALPQDEPDAIASQILAYDQAVCQARNRPHMEEDAPHFITVHWNSQCRSRFHL